ncbi:MAG: hypothetical protein FWE80_01935 [Oscillospiraceae bacterium]|nr:hypothetical protein [Oscillospiraceae bacterium]
MLEVCARFPYIGGITGYQALPAGERALYDQFVLVKIEEDAKGRFCPFLKR